jgi:hypothetical protein
MPTPIIVVHDEVATRELAVSTLCATGLQAVGCDDPMKALLALEADGGVRVLVTRIDFGPGKLNGAALARILRVKRREIRLAFVDSPENRVHVEGYGEFVPTPLNPYILVDTVARLLTAGHDNLSRLSGQAPAA